MKKQTNSVRLLQAGRHEKANTAIRRKGKRDTFKSALAMSQDASFLLEMYTLRRPGMNDKHYGRGCIFDRKERWMDYVFGLPNETVSMRSGSVFINNHALLNDCGEFITFYGTAAGEGDILV